MNYDKLAVIGAIDSAAALVKIASERAGKYDHHLSDKLSQFYEELNAVLVAERDAADKDYEAVGDALRFANRIEDQQFEGHLVTNGDVSRNRELLKKGLVAFGDL